MHSLALSHGGSSSFPGHCFGSRICRSHAGKQAAVHSLRRGGSLLLPLPCCTTFLHLLSFNVLIKWLIREVIHEKDGYLDKTQKLVAALSPQISILHKRERQKRQIFVPLSFHHCSSKDQSLQKINLKENFWCIWWSLVVDRSAAGSIWSMQSQSWDYLKVSVVLWLTSVYFIFYMAQSEPYIDNILLLLFNTWNFPFSCSV